MDRFSKNDEVIIVSDNFWNNKIGKVISDSNDTIIEDDKDITEVTVSVEFDKDKYIIQLFPRYQLLKYTKNENLVEILTLNNTEKFKKYFIGKSCTFDGLDYSEIYAMHEQDDGSYDFDEEDLDDINYYKSLTKIPCKITDCVLMDDFDPDVSIEDNFLSCYWDLEFETGDQLFAISGENVTLDDLNLKILSEAFDNSKEVIDDYLHDYVADVDSAWFFIDKIADAEGKSRKEILNDAKKLGYKIYSLTSGKHNKLIVAASEYSADEILNDCIDYYNDDVTIQEVV